MGSFAIHQVLAGFPVSGSAPRRRPGHAEPEVGEAQEPGRSFEKGEGDAMNKRLKVRWLVGFQFLMTAAAAAWAQQAPVLVSPGGEGAVVTVDQRCPTFIWGEMPRAERFELAVYAVDDTAGTAAEPVLTVEIPASAQAWVPPVERCLDPGSRYAWTLRGLGKDGSGAWSEPSLFAVAPLPTVAEARAALETLAHREPQPLETVALAPPAESPARARAEPSPDGEPASRSGAQYGITVEGLYRFTGPKTGVYPVPGNSFVSGLDGSPDRLSRNIHGYSHVSSGGSPFFVNMFKEVNLPESARVTRLTCRYMDNVNPGGISADFVLRRRSKAEPTSSAMAEITISTGATQNAGILTSLDVIIDDPFVINASFDYYLFVSWNPSVAGSNLRFYGCDIQYTYQYLAN